MATNRVLYAVAVSAACALATVTACDRDAAEAPPRSAPQAGSEEAVGFAHSLHEKVTVDNVVKHLSALQEIADKNNNTRAAGTAGFDQSVDYVVKALKDKGFDVQTPEFSFKYFQAKSLDLTVGPKKVDAGVLSYSPGGRVEGRLVPAARRSRPVVRSRITTGLTSRAQWCLSTADHAHSPTRKGSPPNAAPPP